ncbi:MAG: hypothetical protein LBC88_07200 [Spirochaetaceae bacterium]|nr:hypothetical protein [Spirochaetaceae bacterium]
MPKKSGFLCAVIAVLVFAPPSPGRLAAQETADLPRTFRLFTLGMTLDELKTALAADELINFRGDRDVSFLPRREENLVEATGLSFIRRVFFQLLEGRVFIMAFTLDGALVDHYSVYTSLEKKYGAPVRLTPREAVWETAGSRLSLERPLTVKYIDMEVFNRLIAGSETGSEAELFLRQEFLNDF